MIRKIIYFVSSPFCERDYNRYGVEMWTQRGWVVQIADLSPVINPDYYELNKIQVDNKCFNNVIEFFSIDKIIQYADSLETELLYFDIMDDGIISNKVRDIISIKGYIFTQQLCTTPVYKYPIYKKILQILLKPNTLFGKIIRYSRAKTKKIDYCAVSGLIKESQYKGHTKLIYAHNYDYDFIIDDVNPYTKVKYGVYIEQDMVFSTDYITNSIPPYATKDNFFPVINNGLKSIETIFNKKIIISMHPRISTSSKSYYIHEVSSDNTYETIKSSLFVVAMYSSAIQFAVFMRKPIVFVTTDELKNTQAGQNTYLIAKLLGCNVINLSSQKQINSSNINLEVNEHLYKKFVENYLKYPGSANKNATSIIIDYFDKLIVC